jgi:hypothetical protein
VCFLALLDFTTVLRLYKSKLSFTLLKGSPAFKNVATGHVTTARGAAQDQPEGAAAGTTAKELTHFTHFTICDASKVTDSSTRILSTQEKVFT